MRRINPNLIRAMPLLLALLCITSAQAQYNFSYPLSRLHITSPFGLRIHPLTKKRHYHNGVDFAARSDPVLSVLDGKVSRTGQHSAIGKFVRLRHGNVETIYGHLSRILVTQGHNVTAGQPIGISGATGRVTGEHLHFSVKFGDSYLDPLEFLRRLTKRSNKPLNTK